LLLQYISTFHIVCPTSHFVTKVLHSVVKVMFPSFKKGLYPLICSLLLIIHESSYVGDLIFHLSDHQATWLRTLYYREYFFDVYGHSISYRSIILWDPNIHYKFGVHFCLAVQAQFQKCISKDRPLISKHVSHLENIS